MKQQGKNNHSHEWKIPPSKMDTAKRGTAQEYEAPSEPATKQYITKMGTSKNSAKKCALTIPGHGDFPSDPITPLVAPFCRSKITEEREKEPIKGVQHLCITWGILLVGQLPGDVHAISFAWDARRGILRPKKNRNR